MYQPLSLSWTLLRCRYHLFSPGRDKEIRGLRVITLLWMVRMVWVSTRTQATCGKHPLFYISRSFKMFLLHFNISVNNQQMSFILVVKE